MTDLSTLLETLNKDYSGLKARIGTLDQTVVCDSDGVTLRLHYPTFRQRQTTVEEFIECIVHYIMAFSLHRTEIRRVTELKSTLSDDALLVEISRLRSKAVELFKRAQIATNRNGEAGELILYLLTEWIIGAPQLLAKMSLKTDREMPVHGADGIHAKFIDNVLCFYWGESKIHADVNGAISQAISSIASSLEHENLKHELTLVDRYIDFSGLPPEAKTHILRYLDPFDPLSNERKNITTCLIGFDFDGFQKVLPPDTGPNAEAAFKALAIAQLEKLSPTITTKLNNAGISQHKIELFFFPVPSVSTLRDLFQDQIGWNQ
jgi:HamA